MSRVAARSQLTAVEYLAWEREQRSKHEFFDSEVFALAGGTPRHNALGVSIGAELRAVLRSRGCAVLSSDQRLAFPPLERYVYPDVTVICDPPVFHVPRGGPGEQLELTGGGTCAVDAIYAGVFELPGE